MNTNNAKLLVSVTSAVVGFGLVRIANHRQDAAYARNAAIMEENARIHRRNTKALEALCSDLDERIANGKFWLQVLGD